MLRLLLVLGTSLPLAGCFDDCPDDYGFSDETGSCYRFFDESTRSWDEAELACERAVYEGVSAHLAVIETDRERDHVNAEMRERSSGYWVGGSDQAVEGQFVWVTGAPLARDDWGAGEPNNDFGTEDCLEYRVGITDRLNDRTCATTMHFTCEWDGVAPL